LDSLIFLDNGLYRFLDFLWCSPWDSPS
jgi:hypothetical protein